MTETEMRAFNTGAKPILRDYQKAFEHLLQRHGVLSTRDALRAKDIVRSINQLTEEPIGLPLTTEFEQTLYDLQEYYDILEQWVSPFLAREIDKAFDHPTFVRTLQSRCQDHLLTTGTFLIRRGRRTMPISNL